ncbi:MAG: hypothetical protein ACFCVD_13105 [Nodosilinea sp.]
MGRLVRRFGLVTLAALVISFGWGQGMAWFKPGAESSVVAQTNPPPPALAPALPLISGSFEDPQGRFQIGILDGYTVSTVGGAPLFQAPDGSLAYTVAVAPLVPGPAEDLASPLLAAAQTTFGRGERFTTGDVQPIAGGGIRIDWVGQLTQGTLPPQPISGKIFARQRSSNVFLLLVAATDAGTAQVSDAITTLGSTLTVP